MNYSGFKKVHEDDEKAILKHKNGSELKIAKKSIKAEHRKALEKLPLYAPDKEVKKFAGGGESGPEDFEFGKDYSNEPLPGDSNSSPVVINVASPQQTAPPGSPMERRQRVVEEKEKEPFFDPESAKKDLGYIDNALSLTHPYDPSLSPPSNQQAPTSQLGSAEPMEAQMGLADSSQSGIAPQAQPEQGAQDPLATPIPQPQAPQMPATPQEHHAQELQSNLSASDAWKNDLFNGHIQPKTYHDLFAEKSTLGKIGTLFGLLVSGAGSGLSHQPNAVLSMMQNEINNDFNAQVKSKENAMNYYRANLAHQLQQAQIPGIIAGGKLTQAEADAKAYALSRMQMNWAAFHDLTQQNQKLPIGSPARQQGDQMLGLMYQAINNENFSIADRAAAASSLMNFGTAKSGEPGYAQRAKMLNMSGNEKINQFQDPRHVPGFGDASIEVPHDVRQELIAKKEYDQAAKNYIDFAMKHKNNWANLNPTQRLAIARQGAVLGAELQGKYRMKTHGGVYKEGEQHFIKTIIPDNAASWQASFNQLPKVQQTIDNNAVDTNNLAKSVGLPEQDWNKKKQSQSNGSEHTEGATGIQKSTGKPIVFKNGKWSYQ